MLWGPSLPQPSEKSPYHTHSLVARVYIQDSGVDDTLGFFRLGISILRMLIRQYLLITRRLHGSLNRKNCISLAGMQGDRYVKSYTTFCVYKLSLKVMRYSARLSPCFLECTRCINQLLITNQTLRCVKHHHQLAHQSVGWGSGPSSPGTTYLCFV